MLPLVSLSSGCGGVYDLMHRTIHMYTPIIESDSPTHVLGSPNRRYMGALSHSMHCTGQTLCGHNCNRVTEKATKDGENVGRNKTHSSMKC